MAREPTCIDCIAEGSPRWRPTPHGGPRSPLCVTHYRARRKRTSNRSHELRVEKNFDISAEEYLVLLVAQDGCCFICRKAKGIARRLAVDHEHNMEGCEHEPEMGCARCIRALLCSRCNELVGFLDVYALARAITLLVNPPARKLLADFRNKQGVSKKPEPLESRVGV